MEYTQTTTFVNGNTADGGEVNTEIVALGQSVNNIVDAQIALDAEISPTKLDTSEPIKLDNNVALQWKDAAGAAAQAMIVNGSDNIQIGSAGGNTDDVSIVAGAATDSIFLTIGASNRFGVDNTSNTSYNPLKIADGTDTDSVQFTISGGDLVIDSATGSNVKIARTFTPNADNTTTNGTAALRWSDLRSVKINGADIGFQNDWKLREYPCTEKDVNTKSVEWFKENANLGIQLLDDEDNLIAVFHKDGTIYANGFKPLSELNG